MVSILPHSCARNFLLCALDSTLVHDLRITVAFQGAQLVPGRDLRQAGSGQPRCHGQWPQAI